MYRLGLVLIHVFYALIANLAHLYKVVLVAIKILLQIKIKDKLLRRVDQAHWFFSPIAKKARYTATRNIPKTGRANIITATLLKNPGIVRV